MLSRESWVAESCTKRAKQIVQIIKSPTLRLLEICFVFLILILILWIVLWHWLLIKSPMFCFWEICSIFMTFWIFRWHGLLASLESKKLKCWKKIICNEPKCEESFCFSFEMDPERRPGAFEVHLKHYQDFFSLLITLASASIAFFVKLLLDPRQQNQYVQRLDSSVPSVMVMLCLSLVFSLLFIGSLHYYYECYCHRKNTKWRYTAGKYSWILTTAFMAVICFFLAYFVCVMILV